MRRRNQNEFCIATNTTILRKVGCEDGIDGSEGLLFLEKLNIDKTLVRSNCENARTCSDEFYYIVTGKMYRMYRFP